MSKLDKSIDSHAIKGVMYLEHTLSSLDNIQNLYQEELKIAEAKGDEQLAEFIKSHLNKLSSIESRVDIYKDYLNSLVGLSWQAYQQGIEIKKKNDDENSNI